MADGEEQDACSMLRHMAVDACDEQKISMPFIFVWIMMTAGKTSGLQNLRMIERERERENLFAKVVTLFSAKKKKVGSSAFKVERESS